MTPTESALCVAGMMVGFVGSALYSGLETGVYSLNRVRLQVLAHQGLAAARLLRAETERVTTLLSTLLIGNNIMNNLGVAMLGILLESRGVTGWANVIVNTMIVTPVLFVFGETLPKDLFAAYADRLMYRLAGVLRVSRWVFTAAGLVAITEGVGRLVSRGASGPVHPRWRVEALVKEGLGHGLLSDEQTAIVGRVLGLSDKRVVDEMTPWQEVMTVSLKATTDDLWAIADRTGRSRFPVVDEAGDVAGVLNLRDALICERASCPSVSELMGPVEILEGTMPIRRALSTMQAHRMPMAMVVDDDGQPAGLVTIKDLVEPITGELSSW
ncbi:CNNM domain-containing protein [Mucisphaera calidilacus]|uniref:Magnesium and cobalt efflux protein CorC n=1 Tax=Mucisphaera calidilacus TaxID=2527982 RepID=A0A518BVC1_9BACT|nr:CNNM domain-containing protein [Mucisphaera calidilacus]QDU70925.1 Magnesium and cobalt efflux protein CorC [Mucisphaera calidilacus]